MKKEYYYIFFAIAFALLGYFFTSQWIFALLLFLFILFDCFFIIRKNEMEKEIKQKEEAYVNEFRYRYSLLIEKDKPHFELMDEIKESFAEEYEEIDKEELNQRFIKEEIEMKKVSKKTNANFYINHHVDALKEHLKIREKIQKREKDKKKIIISYLMSICFMMGLRILLHPYYTQMIASSMFTLFLFFFVVLIWLSVHVLFFRKECVSHEKMESNDMEEQ